MYWMSAPTPPACFLGTDHLDQVCWVSQSENTPESRVGDVEDGADLMQSVARNNNLKKESDL